MKKLTLSQAIDGFLLFKAAEQLSPHTIQDYTTTFRRFQAFLLDDLPIASIQREQVEAFLASLAQPRELTGAVKRTIQRLSKKTILNYHIGLSALWTWALDVQAVRRHVVREIARPDPEKRRILAFTEADARALLEATERSRAYARPGKRISDHGRPTAARDRAIIFLLLDTGMRASELTTLTAKDVDLKNRRIYVLGKGTKERTLPISAETSKVLWKYLSVERKDDPPGAPLFVGRYGDAMTRVALLQIIKRLGDKAGIVDCHPHRFRHTFAITFLRNGGNAYELQMALGHTTLEMVRVYLQLAETDLEKAHQQASPVFNWRLRGK